MAGSLGKPVAVLLATFLIFLLAFEVNSADCISGGIAVPCEPDCDGNGIHDSLDIAQDPSLDCNRNGVPDSCDLAPVFSLETASELEADGRPFAAAAGDLDGDGDLDLVSANSNSDFVTVLLNQGERRYSRGARLIAGPRMDHVTLVDIDGDEDLDLLASSDRILLFRNRGAGEFLSSVEIVRVAGRFEWTASDFDGDRDPDIILTRIDRQETTALVNRGDGVFLEERPLISIPGLTGLVIAADVDGDSDDDLILAARQYYLFRNLGDGAFSSRMDFGLIHSFPVAADLDGDGDLDLISNSNGYLHTAINAGGGNFQPTSDHRAPVAQGPMAAADLDSDGDVDLVASSGQASKVVLFNDGSGTFHPGAHYVTGSGGPITQDLDGDGHPDVVVPRGFDSRISTLWNRGSGDLEAAAVYTAGYWALRSDDLDGDGDADLVTRSPGGLQILKNLGQGTFEPAQTFDVPGADDGLVLFDLDRDGDLDLAVGTGFSQIFLIETFDNGSSDVKDILNASGDVVGLASGDLDDDGYLDLVAVLRDGLEFFLNLGSGGFSAPVPLGAASYPGQALVADLDGDGDQDIAVSARREGQLAGVAVFKNRGGGDFNPPEHTPVTDNPGLLTAADFDQDGDVDLVMASLFSADLLLNRGDGSFARSSAFLGDNIWGLAAGDLDGDGHPDLVFVNRGSDRISIVLRPGLERRQRLESLLLGIGPGPTALADFNGDGLLDLAIAQETPAGVGVLFNASDSFSRDCNGNGIPDSCDLASGTSADRLGDGVPDECQRNPFHRGDANDDGDLDISDPVFVLEYLFLGGREPTCLDAADGNGDSSLDISDGSFLLLYLFLDGPPPPAPGPINQPCGINTPGSGEGIGCGSYRHCLPAAPGRA